MATLKQRLKSAVDDARATNDELSKKAESEGREFTSDEKATLDEKFSLCRSLKSQIDNHKALDDIAGGALLEPDTQPEPVAEPVSGKSWGEQFVESPQFKACLAGERKFTDMGSVELKTTLTSDTASGGDLIAADVRPGILPLLAQPLTIADLLPSAATNSNTISYMVQTSFTNAADTVAEAAAKPESAMVFDKVDELVRKIAHWIPVTDEMLDDVPALAGYINAQLTEGIRRAEEDQLLNGTTTPPDLVGILNRTGLTAAQARGTDSNVDAIAKEIFKVEAAAFLPVDGIVMNPTNWQTAQLMKDSNGNYMGGGPFVQFQGPTMWGRRVVVTTSIVANTALVGSFRSAAQVFRNGGISVDSTNAHNDYFVKNLTAIRAEERLALAVYRPAAFGKVTGLN